MDDEVKTPSVEEVEASTNVTILSDIRFKVTMTSNIVYVHFIDGHDANKKHHIRVELPMNPSGTFISKKQKPRVLGEFDTYAMMAVPETKGNRLNGEDSGS